MCQFCCNAASFLDEILPSPLPSMPRKGRRRFKADIKSFSDFPTLSSGRPQASSALSGGWNSNVIRQPNALHPNAPAPSQQQRAPSAAPSHQSTDQFENQRPQPTANERESGEDFPPLGGQLNGDSGRPQNGFGGNLPSSDESLSQNMSLPIRGGSAFQQTQQAPSSASPNPAAAAQTTSAQGGQPSQQPASAAPAGSAKRWADMTEPERYGMMGLLAQLEARRQIENGGEMDDTLPAPMRNAALFMGQDLNTLGMDLDSPDPIYPTFTPFPDASGSGSMFDSRSRQPIPFFTLPPAYTVTNVPPVESRMSAFSDETLFNIFYQNPRDIHQEMAATELSARDWRWHKVLRQWLQKDSREANTGGAGSSLPVVDLTAGNVPIGVVPVRTGERTERGVYIFFDAANWRRERREFVLDYDQLDHRVNPAVAALAAAAVAGNNPSVGAGGGAGGTGPGLAAGSGGAVGQGAGQQQSQPQPQPPPGMAQVGAGGQGERQGSVHSGA